MPNFFNFDINYFAGQNTSDLTINLSHWDDEYWKQPNDLVPQTHKMLVIAKPCTEMAMLKYVINKGDDINARDINGLTILHLAILLELSDLASYSIDLGVDIEAKDILGRTALHMAAMKGNQDIVRILVDHNCNVNAKDHYGNLPLHAAVSRNHPIVAEYLIKLTNNATTPLIHIPIIENDAAEFLECLILAGHNIEDKDILGRTALHIAAMKGNHDVVKLLVNYGCNVNTKDHYGNMPLHIASINNDAKMIRYLMKVGADINSVTNTQQTPLHLAVIKNNKGIVKLLVNSGAHINAKNIWEVTPLILSILNNNQSIHKYLSDNKAVKTTVMINEGIKKLHYLEACNNNLYVVIDPHNDRGVIENIESKNNDGYTVLCIAAKHGKLDLVKWLVDIKNANIEAKDKLGYTPLHIAVLHNHEEVVKYLVKKDANILTKNIDGRTPFYYLISANQSKECKEIFKCLVTKKKKLDKTISSNNTEALGYTILASDFSDATKYVAKQWLYYKMHYTFCPTDDNVSVLIGHNTFELLG